VATVYTDTIEPRKPTQDITLGTTGETITLPGNDLRVNTVKDKGGNTLWTSDGSGNLSSVNAGLKGNLVLLTTNTFTNAATSDFTTLIDSTYDVYIFKFIDINAATSATQFSFQVNAVGASGFNETVTSTWFHAVQQEADGWAGLEYQAANDQAQGTGYQYLPAQMGAESDESCAGELHLFSPSSTTYVKHFYSRFNNYGQDNTSRDTFVAGYFNLTTAIDEISFKMTSGNFDGTIKMYGLL